MAGRFPYSIGKNFQFVLRSMWFDAPKVFAALDAKTYEVLRRTGGWGRKFMKYGMRRTSKVSPADNKSFPSAHNGLLRDLIEFGVDVPMKRLIVGPEYIASAQDKEVSAVGMTVPELVNAGGTIKRAKIYDPEKNQIRHLRRGHRLLAWHYRPRPFVRLTRDAMIPILKKNLEEVKL